MSSGLFSLLPNSFSALLPTETLTMLPWHLVYDGTWPEGGMRRQEEREVRIFILLLLKPCLLTLLALDLWFFLWDQGWQGFPSVATPWAPLQAIDCSLNLSLSFLNSLSIKFSSVKLFLRRIYFPSGPWYKYKQRLGFLFYDILRA